LLFEHLARRGLAAVRLRDPSPRTTLATECRVLMADSTFQASLRAYLAANPVVAQSIETVLTQLAFSAGVDWRQASQILQPLAHLWAYLQRAVVAWIDKATPPSLLPVPTG
jgi:hypothetical protein